jgi:hypothetical protein
MQAMDVTRGLGRIRMLTGVAILSVVIGTGAVEAVPITVKKVTQGETSCQSTSASVKASSPSKVHGSRYGIELLPE